MLIPEGALLFALHPAVVDAALGRNVPQEVWGSGLMGDHPMTHVSVVNNHGDRFRHLSGWGGVVLSDEQMSQDVHIPY